MLLHSAVLRVLTTVLLLSPAMSLLLTLVVETQLPAAAQSIQNRKSDSEIASFPSNADDLFKQGKTLYKNEAYDAAIKVWLQALVLYQNNPLKESEILSNITFAYLRLENAPEALRYAELAVQKSEGTHPDAQSFALLALGEAYHSYERYPDAVRAYKKALSIVQKVNDPKTRANILIGLGETYTAWAKYTEAIKVFQEVEIWAKEAHNARLEEQARQHLDYLLSKVSDPGSRDTEFDGSFEKCEIKGEANYTSYRKRAECFRDIGAKGQEISAQVDLGSLCFDSGNYSCALDSFSHALVVSQEIGVREREAGILQRIATLFNRQNRPELAIVFLKKAVSIYESIRAGSLPPGLQDTYIQQVAQTYRDLANLLLQQDRVLEAQQVLDLLKVQELDDYLRNVRGTAQTIEFRRAEQEILTKYNELQKTAIAIGSELANLRKLDSKNALNPTQKQRLTQLVNLETAINAQFVAFVDSPEIKRLAAKLQQSTDNEAVNLNQIRKLKDQLQRLDAVLLYPLILENRLELVLAVPGSPPLRRTVNVTRQELNATILAFRTALGNRQDNAQALAEKLYGWLIKPLEADLKQAQPKTILYAPDGQLRYIPLAALHDGNQWLVERYRINNITALAVSDLVTPPHKDQQVLAAAFGEQQITIPVGNQSFQFAGLPFAQKEVQALVSQRPGTVRLFGPDFSLATLQTRMNSFNIVHLATHGKFLIGNPKKSFLVMGNGDRFSLSDIQDSTLDNVDLVVLSACETGVGLTGKDEDGVEVLGIGYQFQRGGAKAAISSLWSINDGGTQTLMNIFYGLLQQGMPKAEALQQAQIALINGDFTASGKLRGNFRIETTAGQSTIPTNLKHPFYWAPFILIGNGL